MNFAQEYSRKLHTAEEAALCVKPGDWVDYGLGTNYPELLDRALAARKEELYDIRIRGGLVIHPEIAVVEADRERDVFMYNSWHFVAYERKLHDANLCNYIPMTFRYLPHFYRKHIPVDVAFLAVSRMDDHGYFSCGLSCTAYKAVAEAAKTLVLEVNERYPFSRTAEGHAIHISEADMIVEGAHREPPELPGKEPSPAEREIGRRIVAEIENGAVLQLGIGALPEMVGNLIAESDLRDLGCHTEMLSDSYLRLYRDGKLTNNSKGAHKGKSLFALALGTKDLYEWLDRNPEACGYSVDYINDPVNIAANDKMISVNSAVSLDLYGQTCAESAGTRNISGTGGQLDFLTGAFYSKGGKGFICLTSTYKQHNGDGSFHVRSRIVPTMGCGDIVTDPRSQAFYIATEYGIVNLAGLSTWERAEKIISIAHPDFREELIKNAEEQKIWRKSNRTPF